MRERQRGRAKYIWLLLITSVLIAALLLYEKQVENSIPVVETTVLVRADVKETTVCQGTVSATNGVEVYAPLPCVAGTLAVEVGDEVKKGDVLFEIDPEATVAAAMATAAVGSESVTELASSLIARTVTAPSDGIVSSVNIEKGELTTASTPCVVLSEGGGVEIAVAIRESAVSKIKVGQEVVVSGVAFEKEVYHGVVTSMASTARTRLNGTSTETVVDAVVTLDDSEIDDSLLIGLSARAVITVDIKKDVLVVPYDCVSQTEDGKTVVYVLSGHTAHRRTVTLGKELANGIEVLGGLAEGDVLVKAPDELTDETVRVTVKGTT